MAPPAREGLSGQRKAAYAIGTVGLAGLALGGVMGGLVLREKGTIKQHCGAAIMAPKIKCDPTGLDAAHRAKPFGLVSTVGWIAGAAALGTGVVLLLTDRTPASPKTGAAGRWIAGEVLSLGPAPAGAMIGARGAW